MSTKINNPQEATMTTAESKKRGPKRIAYSRADVVCAEDTRTSVLSNDPKVHLKRIGGSRTLCEIGAGRELVFIPSSCFGNNDGNWCDKCSERLGRK